MTNNNERSLMAETLATLSTHKVATFILDQCEAVIFMNDYKDNWKEFKDFFKAFEQFPKNNRAMPDIFIVLKYAEN